MLNRIKNNKTNGFALFFSLVFISALLLIIATTLNSALGEFRASSDEIESLKAFYAADTAIECVRYYQEKLGAFNSTVNPAVHDCGAGTTVSVGGSPVTTLCEPRTWNFTLSGFSNGACADVTVTTDEDPNDNSLCTMLIEARGKNTCGSGAIVERTRWESWVGLPLGAGNLEGGLVGHWQFDEGSGATANDSSGYGNAGTLTNGPVWTTGKIGGALDFDGVDDYVNIGSVTSLNNVRPISISAWIYPRSHGEGDAGRIISKHDATGRWSFHFNTTGRLRFHKDFSGASELNRIAAGGTIAVNDWQHVVVTWDGSSNAANVHIYRNGGETGYSTTISGINPPDDDSASILRIGAWGAPGNNVFDGLIDDVRIYNRVLNPAEILQLCRDGGAC